MKNYIITSLMAIALVFSVVTPARAVTIADLQAQIQQLMAQIASMRAEQSSSSSDSSTGAVSACVRINSNLIQNMSGAEVTKVQSFLIKNGYSLGVSNATGFYGVNTKLAIESFQKTKGIAGENGVGPRTREAINNLLCVPQTNPGVTQVSVSGPSSLGDGQNGDWMVRVSNPDRDGVTYGVIWGDEPAMNNYGGIPDSAVSYQNSSSFSHSYKKLSTTGTIYNPTFFIKNKNGNVVRKSVSVSVGFDSSSVAVTNTCKIDKNLYFENVGDDVRDLQKFLNENNYSGVSNITGAYSVNTKLAVEAFQKANGITGEVGVGDRTRTAINALIDCRTDTSRPVISNVQAKEAGRFEINGGYVADISGYGFVGTEKSNVDAFVGDIKVQVTSITDNSIRVFIPDQFAAGISYDLYLVKNIGDMDLRSNTVKVKVLSRAGSEGVSTIKVISPNGGERISYGEIAMAGDLNFKWSSSQKPSSAFKAYIVNSDGVVVRDGPLSTKSNIGNTYSSSFAGDEKIVLGTNYKIKVCDTVSDNTVCDTSDGYFTVVNPATPVDQTFIRVLSPNGGEVYSVGQNVPITFVTSLTDKQTSGISFQLYKKTDSTFGKMYVGNIVLNWMGGSPYNWTIPNLNPGEYYIYVAGSGLRDVVQKETIDFSDASFTVSSSLIATCKIDKNLYLENRGDDVRDLQKFLNEKGYSGVSNITGAYSVNTKMAVEAFQKEKGITGEVGVGDKTRAAINALISCGSGANVYDSMQAILLQMQATLDSIR